MRAIAAPPAAPLGAEQNQRWLRQSMAPSFFAAMGDEPEALGMLERELGALRTNRHLILADRPKALVLATLNLPGSLYETLRTVQARNISYAMFAHSTEAIPGTDRTLEIQRFEFDRKEAPEVAAARGAPSRPACGARSPPPCGRRIPTSTRARWTRSSRCSGRTPRATSASRRRDGWPRRCGCSSSGTGRAACTSTSRSRTRCAASRASSSPWRTLRRRAFSSR